MADKYNIKDKESVVGFGGLDKVRFRQTIVPESELIMMVHIRKIRHNMLVICDFQGFVDRQLVVDGVVRGVILPPEFASSGLDETPSS